MRNHQWNAIRRPSRRGEEKRPGVGRRRAMGGWVGRSLGGSMVSAAAIVGMIAVTAPASVATTRGDPDYFTELFDADDNDLDNQSLTLTPDGSADFYHACAETNVTKFPSSPDGGTPLTFLRDGEPDGDDGFVEVTLSGGAEVSLYGTSYGSFFVGSNGYLTFVAGDVDFSESLADHFAQPRVSGLFDDLRPASGGTATWKQWADRVVVTFEDIPELSPSGSKNSFQIELFFDGTPREGQIRITHLDIDAVDGLVGLSAGQGVPLPFVESDLSRYPFCDPNDSCCSPGLNPGCGVANCQSCVCSLDAFCCQEGWDSACVDVANVAPCAAVCECDVAPDNPCTDPIVLPAAGGVFTGMTDSGASATNGSCGGRSPEAVFEWTPTRSGQATIFTCGGTTDYDTVLYVRAGSCAGGVELACDEDNFTQCSFGEAFVSPTVEAGETYYIFVDGFGLGTFGDFTLTVIAPSPTGPRFLGATGNRGEALIDIHRGSGAGTFFAPAGAFGPVTDIESRSDGTIFGATGQGASNIITIDPLTGAEMLVGGHVFGAVNALEFVDATLYGAYVPFAGDPSQLVMVDQSTGALTFVGSTGRGAIGGLAFDEGAATMYAVADGDLLTINLATGAATPVGPTDSSSVGALEFAADGTLYGGTGGNDSSPGALITIDKATGVGSLVGLTGFPALSGLALLEGAPLDVDVSGRVDVATDGTYVARYLLGLDPVPGSFRDLDPAIPSDAVIGATVAALGSSLDVDANALVDVATDITYIARHLLGLDPVPASFRDLDPTIPPDSEIVERIELLT